MYDSLIPRGWKDLVHVWEEKQNIWQLLIIQSEGRKNKTQGNFLLYSSYRSSVVDDVFVVVFSHQKTFRSPLSVPPYSVLLQLARDRVCVSLY